MFVLFYLVFVVNMFFSRPRESSVGLLFILAGLVVYLLLAETAGHRVTERAKPYNAAGPPFQRLGFRTPSGRV